MRNEVLNLATNSLSYKELDTARDHLKGDLLLSSESTDTRMKQLARNEITHGRPVFYKEVVRNIEAVTQDATSSLADACLKDRLSMACLGTISDSELFQFDYGIDSYAKAH
ncbi:MAG: hypothetical protein ACUVQ6_05220 [Dissulfurimicrobium sp.]|uniref:hypothetical protein n=1 Tax=Dissulfurimicrobium sp. TaxID=2022436 RepID=UPI00404A9A87